VAGSRVLNRVEIDLESRPRLKSTDLVAKARARSVLNLESPFEHRPKAGKG
jgi:hypothetical protein